ncbi:MAG: hypothetical protein AB7G23_20080 [Vicinamibacterales bacterium]
MAVYVVTAIARRPVPADHSRSGREADFAPPPARFESLSDARLAKAKLLAAGWEVELSRSDAFRSHRAEPFTPAAPESVALALKKARAALHRDCAG